MKSFRSVSAATLLLYSIDAASAACVVPQGANLAEHVMLRNTCEQDVMVRVLVYSKTGHEETRFYRLRGRPNHEAHWERRIFIGNFHMDIVNESDWDFTKGADVSRFQILRERPVGNGDTALGIMNPDPDQYMVFKVDVVEKGKLAGTLHGILPPGGYAARIAFRLKGESSSESYLKIRAASLDPL